jgi:hypothetical protein
MNRREFVKGVGVAGGAILGGGLPGLVGLLPAAQAQTRATVQAMPTAATDLHAKGMAKLPPSAQQWIHDAARRVARTPGAEDSAEFHAALSHFHQQFPSDDLMAQLFYVFKESVDQTNADKRYFLGRLSEMNEIAQALSEYLQYLNSASGKLGSGGNDGGGKKDGDPVCAEGRAEAERGLAKLQALRRRLPPGATHTLPEPRTIGDLKAAIKGANAELRSKEQTLRRSIGETSARLELAQARYDELFPKMTEAMKKVPHAR